ncbi:hypothetical protein AAY72_15685, partial [Alishewanella sp. WH16-1]|uniref:serine/threonine protein kinase n=1 Tax=Alishewanella sp. WH16-1 TaxID=1651088 RepID=UPI00070B48A5
MLSDSEDLRTFVKSLYPNFEISDVAKRSGQRVVYFGSFIAESELEPEGCSSWGEVVLKISEAGSRAAISYVQKEVSVLREINNSSYPVLHFSEVITADPGTEEMLEPIRFVSIEERIYAEPLSEKMQTFSDEKMVTHFLLNAVTALSELWSHPQRLVHRDLKPDNILIKPDGSLVIIDLGILREEGTAGVTNSYFLCGPCTPLYASPEQAKNEKQNISFKSDMFSLGVIVYEMLTGINPFKSTDGSNFVDEILERVCSYSPDKLQVFGVSSGLSEIVDKLMQKEPFRRLRISVCP